jgi:alkaline phosphatase D
MSKRRLAIIPHALLLSAIFLATAAAESERPRPAQAERMVLLLLFDGWAPSMLATTAAPTMERLRREGAWSHRMVPAFPTISLVNQVTVSTGCWPEHHGIVTNVFRDPARGQYDHSHDADWLIGCEHLHETAERQGVRTAALGWVGRFSTSRGDLATRVSAERKWPEFPDDPRRTEQVLQMLRLPDGERPRLVLAYFKGPDGAAHFSGLDSAATQRAVAESDAQVGRILGEIAGLPFRDRVTVIVTTDHGMLPVSHNVNISKILLNHGLDAEPESSGTTSLLYFKDPTEIERALTALSQYTQFTVVRPDQQPPDWHLGTSPRLGGLIVSAHPPYFIEDIHRWPSWARWMSTWGPEFIWAGFSLKASHGYPPETPGVEGIFYAWGAGISAGREVASVRAVDIHPTVAQLLGIAPGNPVDGKPAVEFLAKK